MDDQRPLVHVRLETAAKLSEAKAYPLASTTSCVGCESTSRADVPPVLSITFFCCSAGCSNSS